MNSTRRWKFKKNSFTIPVDFLGFEYLGYLLGIVGFLYIYLFILGFVKVGTFISFVSLQRLHKAYLVELAQFHSADYVEILHRITPDTQHLFSNELAKCKNSLYANFVIYLPEL